MKLEYQVPVFAFAVSLSLGACGSDSVDGRTDYGGVDGDTGTADGNSAGSADGNSSTGDGDPSTGDGDPATGDGDPATGDGDEGSGIKFDVHELPDGSDAVVPGPGSCRPSEIYGAAGGFPAFTDPAYANFLDRTVAIVTHNNWDPPPIDYSLTIVDISGPPPPPNINYFAPIYHQPAWTKTNLGRIFGLTLDSDGNIYVAPTTVYGANPSPATIKRIDRETGEISNFATLPNNGPALGNINYDCVSQTLYASNHEDGRIYQLAMDGTVVSTYHHATGDVTLGPANDPGEPNGVFAPLGERVWAVQSHAARLYYSVWWEDSGRQNAIESNEIWSVAYVDEDGVPDPATAQLEFKLPNYSNNYSNPVSDISFAASGWMLVSQRTMINDAQTSAHQSTTYEYNYVDGNWISQGTTYLVGELVGSATGGVDHDFEEGGYVWMTGDALDFYTPDVVYGLQGTPYGGGSIENSTIIDLDHEITQQDKTVYGDVELPIPGYANPVPPPG
jgi:hypothetical protein